MRTEFRNEVNELIERHRSEITHIKRSVIENPKETYEKIAIKTKGYCIYIKDDGDIRVWQHITEDMIKCETLKEAENLVFDRDITYKTEVMEMIDKHAHEIVRYESRPTDNYGGYFYRFIIETNDCIATIFCSESDIIAKICAKKGSLVTILDTTNSVETYLFEYKDDRDEVEIACDRILNCNSDWLEKAVAENNIHEVQLELSGLIIDELLRYIDDKDIENAVHERINKLK